MPEPHPLRARQLRQLGSLHGWHLSRTCAGPCHDRHAARTSRRSSKSIRSSPIRASASSSDIETFLKKRTSCFAKLHVKNPQFEEVRVRFKLQLNDGYDEAYYTTQLQQAITRFLSPWAFTGIGVPSFGGKIYKSVLINFVEEQPYVDYVTDFQLFHDIPCDTTSGNVDLDEVTGSRAVSILVSAPASKHRNLDHRGCGRIGARGKLRVRRMTAISQPLDKNPVLDPSQDFYELRREGIGFDRRRPEAINGRTTTSTIPASRFWRRSATPSPISVTGSTGTSRTS